jgi:hypothetical protein
MALALLRNSKFIGLSVGMAMITAVAMPMLVKEKEAEDVGKEAKASDDQDQLWI